MDPRTPGSAVQSRSANHSPLMAALTRPSKGEVQNFCPYGCTIEELDANGYCEHLIGFSNDQKFYEPMITDDEGNRRVKVHKDKDGKPVLEPVLKTDKLERITVSHRVYRDVVLVAPKEDKIKK